MIENGRKRGCPQCGDPVDPGKHEPYCTVCHWKNQIRKLETEIALMSCSEEQRQERIQRDQASLTEMARALVEYQDRYRSQQNWWRRLLGICAEDDKIKRMNHELYRLQSRLESSQGLLKEEPSEFLKSARKRLSISKSELRHAKELREDRLRHERSEEEERLRFAGQCRHSLEMDFDSSLFRIRDQDHQETNSLDHFFRKNLRETVLEAFANRCVRCGADRDLTLDHFGLVKRNGGNFILALEKEHALKPNVTVLCRSCKRSRGELDYLEFFTEEERTNIKRYQALLLEEVLRSPRTLSFIRKWYRNQSFPD